MKVCTKCKVEQTKDCYENRGPGKLRAQCRTCIAKIKKARRVAIRECFVAERGNKCAHCGIHNEAYNFFDWHHRDPTKKEFFISAGLASYKKLKPEIDKCDLLCPNCHRLVHLKENDYGNRNLKRDKS